MPDLEPKALLSMTPNRRWASRMNQAWTDCRGSRPSDAKFYTDYAPREEVPDTDREPVEIRAGYDKEGKQITKSVQPVKRVELHGKGRIQVWRPGDAPKSAKGAMTEIYDGEPWYGFSALIDKSTNYEDCLQAVVELLSKFKD